MGGILTSFVFGAVPAYVLRFPASFIFLSTAGWVFYFALRGSSRFLTICTSLAIAYRLGCAEEYIFCSAVSSYLHCAVFNERSPFGPGSFIFVSAVTWGVVSMIWRILGFFATSVPLPISFGIACNFILCSAANWLLYHMFEEGVLRFLAIVMSLAISYSLGCPGKLVLFSATCCVLCYIFLTEMPELEASYEYSGRVGSKYVESHQDSNTTSSAGPRGLDYPPRPEVSGGELVEGNEDKVWRESTGYCFLRLGKPG